MGGKPLYDATGDSDGMVAFKSLCATTILIAGIVIPVKEGMGQLGTLICIFGGIGLAIAILKNT